MRLSILFSTFLLSSQASSNISTDDASITLGVNLEAQASSNESTDDASITLDVNLDFVRNMCETINRMNEEKKLSTIRDMNFSDYWTELVYVEECRFMVLQIIKLNHHMGERGWELLDGSRIDLEVIYQKFGFQPKFDTNAQFMIHL